MTRKKNRICKCGKKFKDHPVEGCDWKPKLWIDRFERPRPFLEVINETNNP
jgi:hypothetical protein